MYARCLLLLLVFVVSLAIVPLGAADEPSPDAQPTADEEVNAFVAELRDEAARIRGLEWKRDVPAAALSREELRAKTEAMVEKEVDPAERERDTRILRRLGMLGPDQDPIEMMINIMENMAGGFFEPDEKKLYLIKGMTGDAQKPIVLHELIHALQDQYIDIKARREALKDDHDLLFAEVCIEEGSAEHARKLYEMENPEIARLYLAEQMKPELARRQMEVMRQVPAYMILPTMLHYQLGPRFVERAIGEGDFPSVMSGLYEEPPVSQEQLLHPSRWFTERRDYPQEVKWARDFAELAGEGWTKLHDLSVGELDLALWLDYFLGFTKGKANPLLLRQGKYVVPRAKAAAGGWDAGRSYYLEKEGLPIVLIEVFAFDTEDDASEALDAIHAALKKRYRDSYVADEAPEATDAEGARPADYVRFRTADGPVRLLQRGEHVFLLDGAPEALEETFWKTLLETTFVRDERDTWDPELVPDVFAGCDYVDENRGLGLMLPGEGWSAKQVSGQMGAVAEISKGSVRMVLTREPHPLASLKPMVF